MIRGGSFLLATGLEKGVDDVEATKWVDGNCHHDGDAVRLRSVRSHTGNVERRSNRRGGRWRNRLRRSGRHGSLEQLQSGRSLRNRLPDRRWARGDYRWRLWLSDLQAAAGSPRCTGPTPTTTAASCTGPGS